MATLSPAPKEQAIEALFGGLVSATTEVVRASAPDPERDARGVFAEFVDDGNELAALAFADHEAVNFVGGAMVGVELDQLQESNDKALLHDEAAEGFREVVNVFASCLNSDYTRHLRLSNVQLLPGQLSDEVKQLWRSPRGRRAYRVSVDGFGSGTIILYLT